MKRVTFLFSAVAVFACGTIVEPVCGCSPPGGGEAVITGMVLDAASVPVAGAPVRLKLLQDESCAEVSFDQTGTVTSGADGGFRHTAAWSGGRKCFRIWADPPPASAAAPSEPRLLRIDYGMGAEPDSTHLVLQLR